MISSLEFDLNKLEERNAFECALYGERFICAVWEFDQMLRSRFKYQNEEHISIEEVRRLLIEHLETCGVLHVFEI